MALESGVERTLDASSLEGTRGLRHLHTTLSSELLSLSSHASQWPSSFNSFLTRGLKAFRCLTPFPGATVTSVLLNIHFQKMFSILLRVALLIRALAMLAL